MAVPYHVAASAIKQIIDTEFVDRSVSAIHDRLHESLGTDALYVGISPVIETLQSTDATTKQMTIQVQWYDLWDKQIDPKQTVDPFNITEMADRFTRAVETYQATNAGTPEVWYFRVQTITYPNDPTGNKTRFEATIFAYGANMGFMETHV